MKTLVGELTDLKLAQIMFVELSEADTTSRRMLRDDTGDSALWQRVSLYVLLDAFFLAPRDSHGQNQVLPSVALAVR